MSAALEAPGVSLSSEGLIALRQVALNTATTPILAALPGGFATRRKGQGLEVADMREYVPGDDLRRLDRGTTARTGRLHVRQYKEERDRVTLLVADFRAAMFWGVRRAFLSVAAAEALALIGWSVVESGGRVGLLALTPKAPVIVPPRGRTRGMLDAIGGMVEAHRSSLGSVVEGDLAEPTLEGALSRVERIAPAGAEIVIASGFDRPGEGLPDRLDQLARRRSPRLLLITDPQIAQMPSGRYPVKLADGRRLRLRLGGAAPSRSEAFREIANRPALVVDAGAPVEEIARLMTATAPLERAA